MKVDELIKTLNQAVEKGFDRTFFLYGPPGVGKSAACKQAAEGRWFGDLRLAQLDPTDVRGILLYNPKSGKVEWVCPSAFPKSEEGKDELKGIWLLDEANLATQAVQAAAYQLVLDRRIGDYEVPDGIVIVLAGNRETDRAHVQRLAKPLENRLIFLDIEPDFPVWKRWALANGVDPVVMAYLNEHSEMSFKEPVDGDRGFPTFRSWHAVSDIVQTFGMSDTCSEEMIKGAVGNGAAIQFVAFVRIAMRYMKKVNEILVGKNPKADDKELSAQFFIGSMLVNRYRKDPKLADRICEYATAVVDDLPEPTAIMLMDCGEVDRNEGRPETLEKATAWPKLLPKIANYMV